MSDPYRFSPRGVTNPAEKAYAVTPNDSNDLDDHCRALWVGTAGNVSVILVGDENPVTFVGVQAGSLLPLRIKRVRSTGTTASDIVGVY